MSAMPAYHKLKFAYKRVLAERNMALEEALNGGCRSCVVRACRSKGEYCKIRSSLNFYIGVKVIRALIEEKQALIKKDN